MKYLRLVATSPARAWAWFSRPLLVIIAAAAITSGIAAIFKPQQ